MDCILTPICEAGVLGLRHSLRPRRGAHDALAGLAFAIQRGKTSWIVDADIRKYCDGIDSEQLVRLL